MSIEELHLPARVTHENLPDLLALLHRAESAAWIELNCSKMHFYHPGALVAILCQLHTWNAAGKTAQLTHFREARNLQILQRMNFFRYAGLDLDEEFERHDATGRFVEIQTYDHTFNEVDRLAREIAACLVDDPHPGNDDFECFKYLLGEILTNAKQHSQGQVFAYSQTYPKENSVGLAIGDTGIGIRGSFAGTSLEQDIPEASTAIRKALEPEISSALLRPALGYGQHVNRGVGLSMVSALVADSCGFLTIVSEDALFEQIGEVKAKHRTRPDLFHRGTLVEIFLNKDQIADFASMRNKALSGLRLDEGLDEDDILFE